MSFLLTAYCAHGFQTLKDKTVVFYQMSEFYYPECARGVRWGDPAFGIEWPELGKGCWITHETAKFLIRSGKTVRGLRVLVLGHYWKG